MSTDWEFNDDNLLNVYQKLSPLDQMVFNCNIKELNWDTYLIFIAIGLRKYIIKDGLQNTKYAVKKHMFLRVIHYIITPLYLYALWKLLTLCLLVVGIVFFVIKGYFDCSG